MKSLSKLILLTSIFYVAFALAMVASNNLKLNKPVDRYVQAPCNPGGLLRYGPHHKPLAEQTGDNCQIDDSTRRGISLSWIEWRYFSNNRGNDEDVYLPIDILVVLLSGTAGMLLLWKKETTNNGHKVLNNSKNPR